MSGSIISTGLLTCGVASARTASALCSAGPTSAGPSTLTAWRRVRAPRTRWLPSRARPAGESLAAALDATIISSAHDQLLCCSPRREVATSMGSPSEKAPGRSGQKSIDEPPLGQRCRLHQSSSSSRIRCGRSATGASGLRLRIVGGKWCQRRPVRPLPTTTRRS
jgi:hypothetical protein